MEHVIISKLIVKRALLMFFTTIFFSFAALAYGQTVRGQLQRLGPVGPYPASDVPVKLYDPSKGYSLPVYTGKDGMYYFPNVKAGEYKLEVETSKERPVSYKIEVKGEPYTDIKPIMIPYEIVMFDKKDISRFKDRLREEFQNGGFRVVELRSPLGQGAQTNALFSGKFVPFTALQSILDILSKYDVKIKAIQYQLNLKSKNPYEIQLGSSAEFNNKPPIPGHEIDRLKKASTEAEFKKALQHQ